MTLAEPARKIVDSVLMTAIARVAMVLALPLILGLGTVGYNWLQAQRDDLQHQVNAVAATANKTADKVDDVGQRLAIVSAKQERDTASVGRFQKEMLTRQDRMNTAITELAKSVAALNATVQALVTDKRNPP